MERTALFFFACYRVYSFNARQNAHVDDNIRSRSSVDFYYGMA